MKHDVKNPPWWKWVVTMASFFSLFLGGSLSYCAGVIHVALLEHFQEDPVTTAWLGSLRSCMFALTGPLAGLVINMFSCRICVMTGALTSLVGFAASSFVTNMRWLFFTYAFLVGIGEGLLYSGSLVVLGYYFKDQVSLPAGVGLAGISVGTFVLPPITQALMDAYSLSGCFLLLGGISFNTAIFGALMRPSCIETELSMAKKSGGNMCRKMLASICGPCENLGDILQPRFALLLISACTFGMGSYVTYLFLPDFLIRGGATAQEASFLLSVVGIGGSISRFLSGMAGNDPQIGPTVLYVGSYGIVGTFDFFIVQLSEFLGGKIAYAFLFGVYASTGWVLLNPMTMQIVGVKGLASSFGIVMFSCGFGALVGPPMAGLIAEATGRYQEGFYFAGVAFYFTSLCGVAIMLIKPRLPNGESRPSATELSDQEKSHDSLIENQYERRQFIGEEKQHMMAETSLQLNPPEES